jgi:hypothetical protein
LHENRIAETVWFLASIWKSFGGLRRVFMTLQFSMKKSDESAIFLDNSLQLSLVKRSNYVVISGNEFATFLENG